MLEAFASFTEDADALLREIGKRVDDAMLREMADADRGRDVAQHFAMLRRIRDEAHVPVPLQWEPREVLELVRWSDPENSQWFPGPLRLRAHLMRAFACTALLRAFGEPDNHDLLEGQNQSLIQLIDSLDALDCGLDRQATGFTWWLLGHLPQNEPEEHPFFGIALLWFALRLSPPLPEAALLGLLDWICEKEDEISGRWRDSLGARPKGRWLLANTHYNLRHAAWERLGTRLMQQSLPGRSAALVDYVHLVGNMLSSR